MIKSIQILKELQYPNGLLSASAKHVKTGYNLVWIRDNIYISLGFEVTNNKKRLMRIYWALLDILLRHEDKIDCAIVEKPKHRYQYIHARYDPFTMNEIWGEWGNKQNDAVGALLFRIGELENKGIKVIRNKSDLRILQKLVYYLASIKYWCDNDNGMWEENEEIHASSVGACVAGLKKINNIVDVPKELIKKGEESLKKLLPKESNTKGVDLALLSLIYPYDIVDNNMKRIILKNVEDNLVRRNGVIRYMNDKYYNINGEAEWTMGFPWLAIIYKKLNKPDKYAYYMRKILEVVNKNGEMPELYYSNSKRHNENTPMGWSQALYLVSKRIQ